MVRLRCVKRRAFALFVKTHVAHQRRFTFPGSVLPPKLHRGCAPSECCPGQWLQQRRQLPAQSTHTKSLEAKRAQAWRGPLRKGAALLPRQISGSNDSGLSDYRPRLSNRGTEVILPLDTYCRSVKSKAPPVCLGGLLKISTPFHPHHPKRKRNSREALNTYKTSQGKKERSDV